MQKTLDDVLWPLLQKKINILSQTIDGKQNSHDWKHYSFERKRGGNIKLMVFILNVFKIKKRFSSVVFKIKKRFSSFLFFTNLTKKTLNVKKKKMIGLDNNMLTKKERKTNSIK